MKSHFVHALIMFSLCVCALIGYGFWYAAVASKSAAVASMQNQIDTKTESAARVASARTALAEIAGDESAVRSYFVPETEIVSFIDDLVARGRTLSATVKILSVSADNSHNQSTLSFSLTVKGTFDAVMRTVGMIEYAPYNLSIAKLSVGKDGKDVWHANIELLVGSVPASPAATSTKAAEPNVLSLLTHPHEYF